MTEGQMAELIIGESGAMRQLRALITCVARSELSVLVQGPTGSGKELVAEAIHRSSGRSGRFVAFNVCAVPDSMFEDALFGHVRGAFTGASNDTDGYLLEAHRGTIFMDEIGGLSLTLQAKLLRVLEARVFRPVGARADRQSEFRVVAAANERLEDLINQGRFRQDLAHRLTGVVIQVPPLAERLEDIPSLVRRFADSISPDNHNGVSFSACALRLLQDQPWPGNVRELRNVVERTIAISGCRVVGREEIAVGLATGPRTPDAANPETKERQRLLALLDECGWDTAAAAARLAVHRATLYRWMQRLAIRPAAGRFFADAGAGTPASNGGHGVGPFGTERR